MHNPAVTFADRIEEVLLITGLSARALSLSANLSPGSVAHWRWRKGKHGAVQPPHVTNPSVSHVKAIADVAKVRLEWLLDGTGPRDRDDAPSRPPVEPARTERFVVPDDSDLDRDPFDVVVEHASEWAPARTPADVVQETIIRVREEKLAVKDRLDEAYWFRRFHEVCVDILNERKGRQDLPTGMTVYYGNDDDFGR